MMVVWEAIPARPRAVWTRSSAKRAFPASFVNGGHTVDARRSSGACAPALIVERKNMAIGSNRSERQGCFGGVPMSGERTKSAEVSLTVRTDRRLKNSKERLESRDP